ncbi:hypothetical protein ENBRE01_1590 [Enteropsectra breve]|nr:hypothetical protein ENBRE01_1590 [Enteropsectra breve]
MRGALFFLRVVSASNLDIGIDSSNPSNDAIVRGRAVQDDSLLLNNRAENFEKNRSIETEFASETKNGEHKEEPDSNQSLILNKEAKSKVDDGMSARDMVRKILNDLSLLVADSDLVSAGGVLRLIFSLCRHANVSSVQARTYFTAEQLQELDSLLLKAIPYFVSGLFDCQKYGSESLMRLRTIRSGVQFLEDEIATSDGDIDLYFAVRDLMENPAVFDLDKKLDVYTGETGDYDSWESCEDLRGVPDEHYWWSDLERQYSERRYGN